MKCLPLALYGLSIMSAPTRGPWIEMSRKRRRFCLPTSAPTRGPWIEIWHEICGTWLYQSAPTRGPWIEISEMGQHRGRDVVGPHTGAVD